jgi:hypothetical protein
VDIEVTGAEQFAAVAKRLRAAGEEGKGLQKELQAAISKEAKPAGRYVAASAGSNLPHRGGLGYAVAGANISVAVQRTSVRMRLKTKGWDLAAMDRGRLRHPVFGNREVWVTQKIRPRLFTVPFQKSAPRVREQIVKAVDDVAKRIEG